MRSLLRYLFPERPTVELPIEPKDIIEARQLTMRLIEEHRRANDRGRKKLRLRYSVALDEAMNILGG